MRSTVSGLEPKWKGKVVFVYITVDNPEERAFMEKQGETSVTTLRFFDKKGKMVKRIQEAAPAETIEAELNEIVK